MRKIIPEQQITDCQWCFYYETNEFSIWPWCNHPDGPDDIEDYEDFPEGCPLETVV